MQRQPSKITYGSWFAMRAARSGNRIALTFEGRDWTFTQLLDEVDRFAAALRDRGVRFGDRVAYTGENHPAFFITMLASYRLGAIFVPINFRLSPGEMEYILNDSAATAVVADSGRQAGIDSIRERLVARVFVGVEGAGEGWEPFDGLVSGAQPLELPGAVGDDDVAIIIYTSGTTGHPKGAMLTHSNMWWNAQSLFNLIDGISTEDVTLSVAPLFHVAGLNVTIPTTWMRGGRVILQRAFKPQQFLADIEKYKVNTLFGVPAMFIGVMALDEFEDADLSSVRLAVCGGAPVPSHVLQTYHDRGIQMLQGYGLSETAPAAIFLVGEHSLTKLGSCGVPAMFIEAKLVDGSNRVIEGNNEVGEICLRGPNVTVGYWNKPEATAAAFDEAGWFHTGDLGRRDDDGFYYIVDRIKDLVITGGENVYPAEVENVLFEYPGVAEVAVIGLPDPKWGEAVTAVVTLAPGTENITLEELREFATARLARYKLPLRLHIVPELPRNAQGKVLKIDLRRDLTD